ncbi:pilus assembly protein TadG-related protein [Micromonospora sp. BQ11]|uniref:pilus assembly protein TadG-related protein n=1 Tax=Micromonospora sp. BQ11 TaxID=3452212 RepID=UPI003F88FDE1
MPVSLWRRLRARTSRADADRGAVSATVGVLLGSGVLLGMAALVVDVGLVYAERGQLQNGADAAAVAAARVCALDPATCTSGDGETPPQLAGRYANGNANDGQATAEVCGRGGGLDGCAEWTGELTDCVGGPPATGPYVEVRTGTRRDGDETLLPPVFAHAVLGGYEGAEVRACARATWGGPGRADVVALALPFCDWQQRTRNGTAFPATPQAVAVLPDTTGDCTGGGGLRWLDAGGDCRAVLAVAQETRVVAPVDDSDHGCGDVLDDLLDRPVLVPVVEGAGDPYTVRGFAAFVVTGFTLPGHTAGDASCGDGVDAYVCGHLTEQLLPGGGTIGGPDLGARVVALIG